MSVNISARAFSLTINGINRTANVINISLSQNELGDSGVFVSGSITLQANYNQVTDFTYLASPSIGANWARGVQVVYRIANDSGTLTDHLLSGARLFILQEPSPPDENLQITLQIGDEATLKNYRTAIVDASGIVNVTGDPSGVLNGAVTPRNTVVENYLTTADITKSISSIPYPFRYSQPQVGTLVDTAGKMARSANHILYTNGAGTLVNRAIDLAASAMASFTIGTDEKLFNYVDSSGIETTVDELVISGLTTKVEDQSFPITSTSVSYTKHWRFSMANEWYSIDYISKRVTIRDYGWNGTYELINVLTETATLGVTGFIDNSNLIQANPAAWLAPESEGNTYSFYDDKSRLTKTIEEKDITQVTLQFSTTLSSNNFVGAASFTSTKFNYQDILTEYTYSDTSVITNKRTETTKYNSFGDNSPYNRLAKEESWGDGFYSIANFYQQANYTLISDLRSVRLRVDLGPWQSSNSNTIYARDSSTKPPSTTYRKPFTATETQINVKLKAKPFAGDSFKKRSRPIDVDFLVSEAQATDYGNTFLALLYGRKQSFVFATAINDNLLTNLKPLVRIDITWNGVIYQCLVDGIVWAHTLTEMLLGMRLIPLRTALVATPLVTTDLVIVSPMISAILLQDSYMSCQLITDNYLGGIGLQDSYMNILLVADLAISVRLIQGSYMTITVTVS